MVRSTNWQEQHDLGVIAAEVAWPRFLTALRQAGGERFEAGGPEANWPRFVAEQDEGADFRHWRVVGGGFRNRSYVLGTVGARSRRVRRDRERTRIRHR